MNTTKDGIVVAEGQKWESLDKRDYKTGTIVNVYKGVAILKTATSTHTIPINKMHNHSVGWRLHG